MATGWKVLDQTQTTMRQGARYVPAIQVDFETTDGKQANVTIPASTYSVAAVTDAINKWVGTYDSVTGLSSEATAS